MVKCRGFKPGGIDNPYYYNRRKIVVPEGSTIKERLQRSTRPTWEELRKKVNKGSETFDKNNNALRNHEYKEKMNRLREEKLLKMKKNINQINNENCSAYSTKGGIKEKTRGRSHSFDRSTPNNELC
ncbi:protein FAM133B-like [Cryptosporidium felis]|nr:protein FAM133B-like [Cryptosporidium felis]